MGILDDLGVGGSIPRIDITGFFSSTWIYVFIVAFIGFVLIVGVCIFLFFLTYSKKIVLFENISGQGYQPVFKSRARVVKLGIGGEELLKTFLGGTFVSAYGRKMGKNTYWYAKGQDGYWYNVVLGDLDSKQGMLDIEPIDRDVRMFHVALDRLSHNTYGKTGTMEKVLFFGSLLLFLVVFILGMWFIVGKVGDAVAPLGQATTNALEIQKANVEISARLEAIARALGTKIESITPGGSGSGIVPAS